MPDSLSFAHAAERNALRRELRARRRALPAAARIAGADALATRLFALPFFPAKGYVAGYWAMDGEIGLHSWQLRLPPGLVYCLPVLADDETLRFAPWRPGDDLVTNRYGIPAYYALHVWAWKANPHGVFMDWNPQVSCEEHRVSLLHR